MTTGSLRPSRPLITVDRVVAALLVVLFGFGALVWLQVVDGVFLYLLFLLATAFVVRTVEVEPGAWLGLRLVRRGLVVVLTLITLDLLTMHTTDFVQFGTALLVLLALGDIALGRATRRLATADEGRIDERQEAMRNRAHRIAYAILATSVGLTVVVAEVATPETRRWLSDVLNGGAIISFIQLLFFSPAMVIAWIEPDRIADEDGPRMHRDLRTRIAYGMVTLAVALPVLMALSLAVAPIRVSAFARPEPALVSPSGERTDPCTYFYARAQAGVGFGATIPLTAVACWNGTTAYEQWGLNTSDCLPSLTELATPTAIVCRRTTNSDGSLHFIYRTVLRSPILPFVSREVVMTLDLTKDGRVVQFP
jgi:hypothetical protein